MSDSADLSTRASATVAEALGLPVESVYVAVGTEKQYRGSATTDDLGRHQLSITITDPKVANKFGEMEKEVLEKLSKLEPLKEAVQFESDAANVVHRRDQLEKFRLAGASIPENFKEWIGFNPDNAERWEAIPKHALQDISRSDDHGISFSIRIAEGEDASKTGGAIKADLEARKGEILALLQKRAEKYLTKGMAPEAAAAKKAEIAQKFAGMIMEVNYNEPTVGDNFSINVRIMSKAQQESNITFKDKLMLDSDKKTLRDSNPLTESNPNTAASQEVYAISVKDVGKALGRAVLFGGEHGRVPTAIFTKIAGKEDMKTAITKQLVAFKESHAGMAKEVDEFLNDEAFKGSDWQKPKRLQQEHKVAPDVFKDAVDPAKANEMTVSFSLKAETATKVFEGLAGKSQAQPAAKVVDEAGNAELSQALLSASNALSAVAAKFAPSGSYAKAEAKRAANPSGPVLGA
ncbi:MAG: hypothetical protein EBV03_02765 [Proteobacteria bacterium]|nr:hypothetical protein [Pseudomonadota bacterium]